MAIDAHIRFDDIAGESRQQGRKGQVARLPWR